MEDETGGSFDRSGFSDENITRASRDHLLRRGSFHLENGTSKRSQRPDEKQDSAPSVGLELDSEIYDDSFAICRDRCPAYHTTQSPPSKGLGPSG